MRVIVIGASGNIGSHLLPLLCASERINSVVGICRRPPDADAFPGVEWVALDISAPDATDRLTQQLRGADVVVHLAWLIQPSRALETMRATNLAGSEHVVDAVGRAGVPALVYASSVGAYSPGPKAPPVTEAWPATGIRGSQYSEQKADVERLVDRFEADHPQVRVVRIRPGVVLSAAAAAEQVRYFVGPFLPQALLRPTFVPVVPANRNLVFQIVHSADVAQAYLAAVLRPVHGPFNIATDPVLDPEQLGRILRARPVPVPAAVLRAVVGIAWRLRLLPTDPGWVRMALQAPVMDVSRARAELGWQASRGAAETLLEWLSGASGAGPARGSGRTPVLRGMTSRSQPREAARGLSARSDGRL